MTNTKKIVCGLILLIIALAGWFFVQRRNTSFNTAVIRCNTVSKNLKFSCYRSVIEKYFQNDSVRFSKAILTDSPFSESKEKSVPESSYAIFGTNCHTFYHASGDFIAEKNPTKSAKELLPMCPSGCTSGCTMGLFKRGATKSGFSDAYLSSLFPSCRNGEEHQCSHEIGHILHDKYFIPILKVLDEQTKQNYHIVISPIPERPLAKVDMNAPYEDCKKYVPEKERAYCLTGVGHNMFLFAQFSDGGYASMFDQCRLLATENVDDCFAFLIYRIGINEGAPQYLTGHEDAGNKACESALTQAKRPDLAKHCYLGIGGGIGLYLDTEYGSRKMTDAIIPEVRKQLLQYASLCGKTGPEHQDDCFAGLWGTRFRILYQLLKLRYDPIERLIPVLDNAFEVVG